MVIDTSALLAINFREPDSERFEKPLLRMSAIFISAGTLLEASIVVEARRHQAGIVELDRLLQRLAVTTVPFDTEQIEVARNGFRKFGKGRHRAGLNYGDCFAYALAITIGEPLLFKGDDFARIDVLDALAESQD